MDHTTALSSISPPQPRLISSENFQRIRSLQLQIAIRLATGTQQTRTLANQCLDFLATTLRLPTCPIQYVAWMQPIAKEVKELKCVQFLFFFPSQLSPQPLWPLSLPEEVMAKGAPICALKDPLRKVFSQSCIVGQLEQEAYGFIAQNWEEALLSLQRIDLSVYGKSLAKEWLHQLENSSPDLETYDHLFDNTCTLLTTLAKNNSCFFTEEEFAPFIATMELEEPILTQWRTKGFIRARS